MLSNGQHYYWPLHIVSTVAGLHTIPLNDVLYQEELSRFGFEVNIANKLRVVHICGSVEESRLVDNRLGNFPFHDHSMGDIQGAYVAAVDGGVEH